MRKPPRKDTYTVHNRLKLVRGGGDYFDRLEAIADGAKYSLHLQTYIFDNDETGQRVASALIRAAKRNVQVFVLLDGYASKGLPALFISGLEDAGIHIHFFKPFFKANNFYIGRRLHHKVIVADASTSMVAGINISNRYNDINGSKAWLDWAIYAEGDVAERVNNVCIKIWNRSVLRERCNAIEKPFSASPIGDNCAVRVRRNDWVFRKTEITKSYRELLQHAKSEVIIMTSYFWPSQKLLNNMAKASARGVNVKLILTATSDIAIAKYTERYLYQWLFRHRIRVYEYQNNVLHGKLGVRDGEWLTLGSYNVNNISALASVELNLDIMDTQIAGELTTNLNEIIRDECKEIRESEFHSETNVVQKFLFFVSYKIVHFVFYLFTFYFVQRRRRD